MIHPINVSRSLLFAIRYLQWSCTPAYKLQCHVVTMMTSQQVRWSLTHSSLFTTTTTSIHSSSSSISGRMASSAVAIGPTRCHLLLLLLLLLRTSSLSNLMSGRLFCSLWSCVLSYTSSLICFRWLQSYITCVGIISLPFPPLSIPFPFFFLRSRPPFAIDLCPPLRLFTFSNKLSMRTRCHRYRQMCMLISSSDNQLCLHLKQYNEAQ